MAENGDKLLTEDAMFVVRQDDKEFDVSRFLRLHPGGRNTMKAFKGKSIQEQMRATHHSEAAHYLLEGYLTTEDSGAQDLERLVDWDQPMFWQVGRLGANYEQWISYPVTRRLRLCESQLLEYLTVTPWYLVPLVWVPIITGLLYCAWVATPPGVWSLVWVSCCLALGFGLWTLFEYSLHRWLFHNHPPAWSPTLITMHFMMHGVHHKVPFDDRRLLMPPVPSVLVGLVLYAIYTSVLPGWMAYYVLAGKSTGYLMYDLMHFYLHYGSPRADTYLYNMKRYHNQHHFAHHSAGFGISSTFWDTIFDTRIVLRRLNWVLRW